MNEQNEEPKIEEMLSELKVVEHSKQLDQRMKALFAQASITQASASNRFSFASYTRPLIGVAALLVLALGTGIYLVTDSTPSSKSSSSLNLGSGTTVALNSDPGTPTESSANPHEGPTAIRVAESQVIDGGFTTTPAGDSVRVLRRESVQRSAWIDPETKAIVQVEEPSEEVVLVSAKTF